MLLASPSAATRGVSRCKTGVCTQECSCCGYLGFRGCSWTRGGMGGSQNLPCSASHYVLCEIGSGRVFTCSRGARVKTEKNFQELLIESRVTWPDSSQVITNAVTNTKSDNPIRNSMCTWACMPYAPCAQIQAQHTGHKSRNCPVGALVQFWLLLRYWWCKETGVKSARIHTIHGAS